MTIYAEIYTFIAIDCKGYLPAFNTITIYFLKDLIEGKRKFVPMERVNHIHVPAYETLKLEEIFSFFLQHQAVIPFMPEDKELRRMPKQWVCNVGATVIGQPFLDWVSARIKKRNEAVTQEKNMLISLDPQIAACFHASNAVSRKYHSSLSTSC